MIRAYARVSTEAQSTEPQTIELERHGAEIIYEEKASGASRRRPELNRLLADLRAGDTLMIVRLDRLARSVLHLFEIVETLNARGCFLRSLSDNIDTKTAQGRLLMGLLATIAEFERALITERTLDGLAAARAHGRVGGNPRLKDKSDDAMRRQIAIKRRAQYLDGLRASYDRWLPTVEALRPYAPWDMVVRRLNRDQPGAAWTKERLVRAVRALDTLGLVEGGRLLARAKPLPPDDLLPRVVAAIVRGRPEISLRALGAELGAMGERTPRGGRSWSPSSVALQLDRARTLGLLAGERRFQPD